MASIQEIWDEYMRKSAEADSLQNQQYNLALGELSNQGAASRSRIRKNFADERGNMLQSLRGRGLFNSTVTDAMSRRLNESAVMEEGLLDERLADRKSGLMERRQINRPNAGFYGNALQMAWQEQMAKNAAKQKKKGQLGQILGSLGGAVAGSFLGPIGTGLGSKIGGMFGGATASELAGGGGGGYGGQPQSPFDPDLWMQYGPY